jgi:hypothetical protein
MNLPLEQYIEYVDGAFRSAPSAKEPVIFTNRGPERASAVISSMISTTHVSLDIISGTLSASIYDEASLRALVGRIGSGKMRVLLDGRGNRTEEGSVLDDLGDLVKSGKIVVRNVK